MTMLDGPAEGWTPMLGRTPWYLRVVEDTRPGTYKRSNDGKVNTRFDCLDQPEDEPFDHERVHVYVLAGTPGFACGRGAGRSGYIADYRHLPDVDGESLRDTQTWRAWCMAPEQEERCQRLAAEIEERRRVLVDERRMRAEARHARGADG